MLAAAKAAQAPSQPAPPSQPLPPGQAQPAPPSASAAPTSTAPAPTPARPGYPPAPGYGPESKHPPQPGYPPATPDVPAPVPATPTATAQAPTTTTTTPTEPAATPTAAPEPATSPYKQKVADSPFVRKGVVIGLGGGVRLCFTDLCRGAGRFDGGDEFRAGGMLRLIAAYRFIPYLAAGVEFSAAYHGVRFANIDTTRAFVFGWAVVPAVYVHPLAFSRADPYVAIGVGYTQDILRNDVESDSDSFKVRQRIRRGIARITVGLDVYVHKNVSVGPRLDIDRLFGGSLCFETTFDEEQCTDVDDFEDFDDDETPTKFALPQWLTFGIDAKGHF